jgi:hypothetical protein
MEKNAAANKKPVMEFFDARTVASLGDWDIIAGDLIFEGSDLFKRWRLL